MTEEGQCFTAAAWAMNIWQPTTSAYFFFKCGYNGDIKLGCSGYIIWDVQRIIEFGIGGSARIRLAREF
jgi:hypothetical protein